MICLQMLGEALRPDNDAMRQTYMALRESSIRASSIYKFTVCADSPPACVFLTFSWVVVRRLRHDTPERRA